MTTASAVRAPSCWPGPASRGRAAACCPASRSPSPDDAAVTTADGLGDGTGDGTDLHPLAEAFVTHDAYQCGYCTPGQICSAVGMLDEARAGHPSAVTADLSADGPAVLDRAEIAERLSGNLCRCAFSGIVSAVSAVSAVGTGAGRRGEAVRLHPPRRRRGRRRDRRRRPVRRLPGRGTNLVDHLKLGVAGPGTLVDVTGLLSTAITPTADGGLSIGAGARNTDVAVDPRVRRDYPALSAALLAGASGSCATWRRPVGTCCSAPLLLLRRPHRALHEA